MLERFSVWTFVLGAQLLVCQPVLDVERRAPVLDLDGPNASYIGSFRENKSGAIDVKPVIQIKSGTGPVCSYVLRALHHADEISIPFEIEVLDKKTGRAELRLKPGAKLDCEERRQYKLSVIARRCAGKDGVLVESEPATLKIRVEDENEFAPVFTEKWYETTIDEGRLYDRIVKLDASDGDCSTKFSEICRFEITNNVSPFTIDSSGVIRNIAPLSWTKSHSYILTVVAHDCGMKPSKPVLVTVNVRRRCDLGWQNVTERLDYSAGSKAQAIFPSAVLDMCDIECGSTEAVNATLVLHSEHIGRGCDRDGTTVKNQHKSCGADERTVSLLPDKTPGESSKDDKQPSEPVNNVPDEEGDQTYFFDGDNNAIIVGPETVTPIMPSNFTLTFWMKHEKNEAVSKQQKENIICTSDDHKLNRHHFAVFVRHCKLEMLFRREFDKKEKNSFRPAEWRWFLPQACDGEWHQYLLTVNFPEAKLLVDGRKFVESNNNFEILDDWPMHATKDLKTKLVVGACWHGRISKMVQFFKGYLAGVTFLPGKVEPADVLQCLHKCRESLDYQKAAGDIKSGLEAVFNQEMTEVTLKAKDIGGIEEMVNRIAYINTREKPTPGHRSVSLGSVVKCKDVETPITIPTISSYIIVKEAQPTAPPNVVLNGSTSLTATSEQVSHGFNIFPDLTISYENPTGKDSTGSSVDDTMLEWCRISVIPALNKDHEYFSSPAALLGALNIDFEHVKEGFILKGPEKPKGYEQVLEQIHYFNVKPHPDETKIFSLNCRLSAGGDVQSNKLSVSLEVKHPVPEKEESLEEGSIKVSNDSDIVAPEKDLTGTLVADKIVATMLNQVDGAPRDTNDVAPPPATTQAVPPARDSPVGAVLHSEDPVPFLAHSAINKPSFGPVPLINDGDASAVISNSSAGSAVAIVVVICVGFLLLLIFVGLVKLRSGSKRRKGHNGELAWDNSGNGLNITVNPMEEVDPEAGHMNAAMQDDDSGDSSDECDSYRDGEDFDDSDEGEEPVLPHINGNRGVQSNGLEWDDTTLHNTHPLHGRSSQNAYRA